MQAKLLVSSKSLLLLMFVLLGFSATQAATLGDDPAASVMVLKVESIQNNNNEAQRVAKVLKGLRGVSDVATNTQTGEVTVKYDKAKMGCCSRIHARLESSNISFTQVSNHEQGMPCGSQNGSSTQAAPGNGNCGSQNGNRPACCRQRRAS